MKGYYYLNFSNLNEETQQQILEDAKDDLIEEYGEETLQEEADDMNIDIDTYLTEKAERHMYSFDFVFNV